MSWPPPISRKMETLLVIAIVALALIVRMAGQWYAPRGWRDDELSSALVVTGHVLDGDFRVYYPDASGHEGLYEYFQAATLLIFGETAGGIRGASIFFGTAAVLLTYLLTRRLFDWPTAAIAAIALAVSFWSLLYSRSGQRHISVTVTTLLSFYFLWRAVQSERPAWRDFGLAGVFMGLGFYTYFAARGVPLIVIGWAAYLTIWQLEMLRRIWRGLVVTLIVALILSVPLVLTLRAQPEAETRVTEIAMPIYKAQAGDFSMLGEYIVGTLSMFSHNGDEEWMYNVPHRPVFGMVGAALFWAGMVIAILAAFGRQRDPRHAFLLLWLGAGITPGMLSIPAASLGHTILAQPVAMMFPALAITAAARWLLNQPTYSTYARGTVLAAVILFLGWEAFRGPYDYIVLWPDNPYNRELHHTDIHEAAQWIQQHSDTRNIAVGGYLVERWDQQASRIDLAGGDYQIRFFDPRSTYLTIPDGGLAVIPVHVMGGWGADQMSAPLSIDAPYEIRRVAEPIGSSDALGEFDNGLTLLGYETSEDGANLIVITHWRVSRPLDLPEFPLYSKPPAPGEDDSPRLAIFVQLLDGTGQRASGADGLGVDPYTLYEGDEFHQRMVVPLDQVAAGQYRLVIGLYNPATMQRILDAQTGQDMIALQDYSR